MKVTKCENRFEVIVDKLELGDGKRLIEEFQGWLLDKEFKSYSMPTEFFDLDVHGFTLRFRKNQDGTYGRPYTLEELSELQFIASLPNDEDYMAALGPCGK